MGVRIDSSASAAAKAAKSGQQQMAASRKDGQPAGAETDFSQVLAQARPKKAASPDKPAPAAKADAKKPVKTKDEADPSDAPEASDASPDAVASRPATDAQGDELPPVDDDGADPVAEADADADDQDPSDSPVDGNPPIDPSQVAVAVTPPQPQAPVAQATSDPENPPAAKPAQATSVQPDPKAQPTPSPDSLPANGETQPTPAANKKVAETPVEHDAEAPKPASTAETGVAIQPVGQPGDPPTDGDASGPEVRAQSKPNPTQAAAANTPAAAQFDELFQTAAADHLATGKGDKTADNAASPTDVALAALSNDASAAKSAEAKPTVQAPVAPDVRFAADNHPKVVTAVKTQLLPGGGSIQLRLDPPDLGPLRLEVRMEDGSMSASFVTASDQATSLLTHTLGQLKHALEAAGVSVDKLQVRQGSAEHFAENSDQQRQQQGGAAGDQSSARQEQQRREMLDRMWRKVAGGDPLDLVA